jgi:hypothetical protein
MPSSKPTLGVNDLQTKFPHIAAEAYGWDPTTVTAGTHQKKDWKCDNGHMYSSMVNNRIKGKGCPICSGRQVLAGFNDLQSRFPEIAAEAHGWDPSSIIAGSSKKKIWKCSLGHTWEVSINSRTSNKSGCPICSNKRLLVGYNDLASSFPDIAKEAHGWDPESIIAGSDKKKTWRCILGHTWDASPNNRTSKNSGCPICSGRQVLEGLNDLQTKFPDIGAEAYGWDPSTVKAGSPQKKDWKCALDHIFSSRIADRTNQGTGCPFCSGQQILKGFNDLQTKFPHIAAEAYGWDPSTVVAGTDQKKDWKCPLGHIFSSRVVDRTRKNAGCSICSGKQVLTGFNDLQTKFPHIAAEAYEWDPTTITSGSGKKRIWRCKKGHLYHSSVANRTKGTGCPVCAEYGFNPEKDAWFYLMERPGEQQIGISNDFTRRIKTHEGNGWHLVDHTTVPSKGQKVLDTEKAFKKWLKENIGVMEGTTENWATTSMEVNSLAELKARSGIETDLF